MDQLLVNGSFINAHVEATGVRFFSRPRAREAVVVLIYQSYEEQEPIVLGIIPNEQPISILSQDRSVTYPSREHPARTISRRN